MIETTQKNVSKQSIQIGPKLKRQLKLEFNCTRQTVHMSLSYFSNSPLAQSIRKRTKELLLEEARKVKIIQE